MWRYSYRFSWFSRSPRLQLFEVHCKVQCNRLVLHSKRMSKV